MALQVTVPSVPPNQRFPRKRKATENGISVRVKSRSATAILAMKRFVTLADEDFFSTTNKPRELPIRATTKITAYAAVMPMLMSAEGIRPTGGGTAVRFGT